VSEESLAPCLMPVVLDRDRCDTSLVSPSDAGMGSVDFACMLTERPGRESR
jgi:hypothetical protein